MPHIAPAILKRRGGFSCTSKRPPLWVLGPEMTMGMTKPATTASPHPDSVKVDTLQHLTEPRNADRQQLVPALPLAMGSNAATAHGKIDWISRSMRASLPTSTFVWHAGTTR